MPSISSLRSRLPDTRPTTGDLIVQQEVKYEFIVEWHKNSISLNLYIRPHSDYQHIVPDETQYCDIHDESTNPSRLDDLPAHFQHQFNDAARILRNKYGLTPSNERIVCNTCLPDGDDGLLQFTQFLDE